MRGRSQHCQHFSWPAQHARCAADAAQNGFFPCNQLPMNRNLLTALHVVSLVAAVVLVDMLFFRHRFWERLMVNIGIVLVFAAFYLRFLKGD